MNKAQKYIFTLLFFLHASMAFGQNEEPALAIEGYSPVSYFTKNKAEKGDSRFSVTHNNKVYYLASEEQVALFKSNPKKYTPKFGQNCAFSLTLGRRMSIDPTNFKVLGDFLLLYHRSEEVNGLSQWNQDKDEKKLLVEAQKQFTLLTFN